MDDRSASRGNRVALCENGQCRSFEVGVLLSGKPVARKTKKFRKVFSIGRATDGSLLVAAPQNTHWRYPSDRRDLTVWKLVSRYLKNPKLQWAFSIQPLLVGGFVQKHIAAAPTLEAPALSRTRAPLQEFTQLHMWSCRADAVLRYDMTHDAWHRCFD